MFNTIILVIIGIIGTIYLFRVVDGIEYNTLRVSDILVTILCFGIIINANITSKNESNAYNNGYTIVREIGGHGVGLEFREDPWVSYHSRKGTDMVLAPGMIFTIEPMVNMGKEDIYIDDENEWEVYTRDGLPSAQWEVMVLVTEDGYEVLSW